tara:strand:- start:1239 stop:1505 length:267 start_codon:yes stop_codon:yes gene_type:complete
MDTCEWDDKLMVGEGRGGDGAYYSTQDLPRSIDDNKGREGRRGEKEAVGEREGKAGAGVEVLEGKGYKVGRGTVYTGVQLRLDRVWKV